jgi:hypothetical protein
MIAHFRYIKYSVSLRGCEAVKLNTKEISSYCLGAQSNLFLPTLANLDGSKKVGPLYWTMFNQKFLSSE